MAFCSAFVLGEKLRCVTQDKKRAYILRLQLCEWEMMFAAAAAFIFRFATYMLRRREIGNQVR